MRVISYNQTNWYRRMVAVLLLASLSGCTSLRTSEEPVGGPTYASDRKARVGLHYFLPKAFHRSLALH